MMARFAPVFALSLSVVLNGCGSAPPVEHPELDFELPERFTSAESRDRAPASAEGALFGFAHSFQTEQLEALAAEALENNLDLAAAAARLDAAAAEARVAGAEIFPHASAGGSASRQQQVFTGLPIPGRTGPLKSLSTSYGVSLDVSWELDVWGRLRNARSAAAAEFEAAAADYQGARLSLVAQTLKAWFTCVDANRQLTLAEDTAGSYRGTVEGIRARYEHGVRSSLDLRLALADQATAEAVAQNRREIFDRAVRQLEILLGRYPGARIEIGEDLSPPQAPVPPGLPAELLGRRPDLVAAERRLAASERRVSESQRALLPRVSLTTSGGRTSNELGDLLDGDFSVWSLVGNLVQPLFQGGRLRAQVSRSHALSEEALTKYANQVLLACAEVESALSAEGYLAEQERARAIAAEQSKAAHELAQSRYEQGLDDIITLLAAQRSAALAESRLLEVRRRRLEARIDLHLSLGGGFDGGPNMEEANGS